MRHLQQLLRSGAVLLFLYQAEHGKNVTKLKWKNALNRVTLRSGRWKCVLTSRNQKTLETRPMGPPGLVAAASVQETKLSSDGCKTVRRKRCAHERGENGVVQ